MFPEKFPDWLYHSQANFPESAVPPKPFTTEPGERDPRSSDSESVDKAVRSPDSLDGIVWMPSIFREGDVRFHSGSNRLLAEFGFLWRETMMDYFSSTLAEHTWEPSETIGPEVRFHPSFYECVQAIDRLRKSFEAIGVGFQLGSFTLPVLFNVLMRWLKFEV